MAKEASITPRRFILRRNAIRPHANSPKEIRSGSKPGLGWAGLIVDTSGNSVVIDQSYAESQALFQSMVESAPAYFYVTDARDASTLYRSPQAASMLGYSMEEWGDNPALWNQILHPDDRERVADEVTAGIKGIKPFRSEYRLKTKLGAYLWVRDHGTLVNNPTGRGKLFQGVVLDITDSKLFEIAQAESAAKTRLLAAMVRIGGLKTLAEVGQATIDQAQELLHADSSTVTWFDPQQDELRTIADSDPHNILPLSRKPGDGAMGLAFRTGAPVVVPDYPSWSGALKLEVARVPASVLAVPLMVHDRITGALAVASRTIRDFSEEEVSTLGLLGAHAAPALELAHLLDQLRQANSELETASHHKTEFLAAMSHELRTPLNSILGFAQLLLLGNQGVLGEKQRRYVHNIQTGGNHLLTLIDGVLDLSKVEAGRIELRSELTTLDDVLQVAVTSLEPLATAKNLQLELERNPDIRLVVDQLRLTQVLINLIGNAIKFTYEGHVRVKAHESGDSVVITIADTGIGIQGDQIERIFGAFIQVDSGIGRQEGGTGLGLALAKQMVALMGGEITVISTPNRGSVFTVALPTHSVAKQIGRM